MRIFLAKFCVLSAHRHDLRTRLAALPVTMQCNAFGRWKNFKLKLLQSQILQSMTQWPSCPSNFQFLSTCSTWITSVEQIIIIKYTLPSTFLPFDFVVVVERCRWSISVIVSPVSRSDQIGRFVSVINLFNGVVVDVDADHPMPMAERPICL